MSLHDVPVGRDVPNDVNVIIEIPMNSPALKYEIDKKSGALFLDRMIQEIFNANHNVRDTCIDKIDALPALLKLQIDIHGKAERIGHKNFDYTAFDFC